MSTDHYEVLGVPRDATSQDIKRAFRRIARECHPDVAGDDPGLIERFHAAREAYEILMDPVARARHDRKGTRRPFEGGSFFDAFYRRTGEVDAARERSHARTGARATSGGGGSNDIGLDDLLDGIGGGRSRPEPAARPTSGMKPQPGRDLFIDLDVPARIAKTGGAVTATYFRMRRADSWTPGDLDPGLVRVEDIAEVRVLPGTPDGTVLRERGYGDAGPWGGSPGDLVVTVRLIGSAEPEPEPPAAAAPTDEVRVDISLVEAILGGRVEVDTPQGPVKLTVAPGTSSHARVRLRGKGPEVGGVPSDLLVTFRIVVPRQLDDASRALIEQFAALNPGPRD